MITLKYLGYWTDNGAYYRYHTQPNTDYAQTMLDIARYIGNISLPVHNYQFGKQYYYLTHHHDLKKTHFFR